MRWPNAGRAIARTRPEARNCFADRHMVHLLRCSPDLQLQVQLELGQAVQCGALSPSGQQLALGGEDGLVHFVAVEGTEVRPLVVTAMQSMRVTTTRLQKLFGRSTRTLVYSCPVLHAGK